MELDRAPEANARSKWFANLSDPLASRCPVRDSSTPGAAYLLRSYGLVRSCGWLAGITAEVEKILAPDLTDIEKSSVSWCV